MDALALLCTLHADGPATLRRLRAAGCDSLAALESLPVDQLGELLHVTPAVARRLEREARALRARVDDDPLEHEEAPEGLVRGSLSGPGGEAEGSSAALDRVDQELLGRVLDTVREVPEGADDSAAVPLTGLAPGAADEAPQRPSFASIVESSMTDDPAPADPLQDAAADPLPMAQLPAVESLPVPAFDPSGGLRAGTVDGLDAELSVDLARAGIVDLAALVAADCDDLAHRTGRSFAQLRRLQFLAKRQLPREPERLAPRAPFGAGITGAVELAVEPAAEHPVAEESVAPDPAPAAAQEPPPFGANIVAPPTGAEPLRNSGPANEPIVPTRQRTEAPGMEHPVPVQPVNTSPRRFWEPRSIYEARTAGQGESASEPKAGRPADAPGEIETPNAAASAEAPPTSAGRRSSAAGSTESVPQPGPAADASKPSSEEREEVLRWNFEIPAPGTMPESIVPPGPRPTDSEREDAAGPFA